MKTIKQAWLKQIKDILDDNEPFQISVEDVVQTDGFLYRLNRKWLNTKAKRLLELFKETSE